MWRLWTACTLAAVAVWAADPPAPAGNSISQGSGPLFRCQVGERLGSELDSLHLVVAASVQYDNLVFLRSDTGFTATFEFVASVFREGSGLVTERIRNVEVNVSEYATTNSRTKNAVQVEEFVVPSGEYKVRVTMSSGSESKTRSRWEGKVELHRADPLLRLSDIYWASDDSTLSNLQVPRLVESFVTTEEDARARVQLYSAGTDTIRIKWTIKGEKGATVAVLDDFAIPDSTIQTHEYDIDLSTLSAHRFTLEVEAQGNGRREFRSREFGVRIPGVPLSIHDLDLAIRQLKYVATGAETKQFRQATPQERERLFKEFWEKRDPTAGSIDNELMNEYYERVEYTNEKFSGTREGWESDRGRIFILYGEPTDIDSHPFEAGSRPYEIWYYSHLARRFVFVDYGGFGDYTLAGPEWGY